MVLLGYQKSGNDVRFTTMPMISRAGVVRQCDDPFHQLLSKSTITEVCQLLTMGLYQVIRFGTVSRNRSV